MNLKGNHHNISLKANRVLNLILIAMLLIAIRIWHLSVIQYDKKLEDSRKPQRRIVIEPARRGTIRDRFNIPLAFNKIHYQAAILYSQLRQIPSITWEKDATGKKIKRFKRKEYISELSKMLGKELTLNPERLEDIIHSQAALYYNIPFIIKEDLSEKEFYRLRIREKDWLGVQVQVVPKRYYPFGKVAGDIIGYMGSINRKEYENILCEIKSLESYLQENETNPFQELPQGILSERHAKKRLQELQGHAYKINDLVGKTGIEGKFEQSLRGFHGKTTYYSDAKGNFLRELPGTRQPLSGQRLLLTLSMELQEFCEQLLAQNEKIREARVSGVDQAMQAVLALRQPWIKGGGILAVDPNTGEILAMASYPRFDPNDFISGGNQLPHQERLSHIFRWLESEAHIAEIWDLKTPLNREFFDEDKGGFYEEKKEMSWNFYLERILPKKSPIIECLTEMGTLAKAVAFQKAFDSLIALFPHQNAYTILSELYEVHGHLPYGPSPSIETKKELEHLCKIHKEQITPLKRLCDPYFLNLPLHYDKILLADLCHVAVNADPFSPSLLSKVGSQTLSFYHEVCGAKVIIEKEVREMTRELFHDIDFKQWRQSNEKDFLKKKRLEEKENKTYSKPYLDYLDAKEKELFQQFWKQHQFQFIQAYLKGISPQDSTLAPYFQHFVTWFKEFSTGAHPEIEWTKAYQTLQKALIHLELDDMHSYYASLRGYEELIRPLQGRYRHLRNSHGKQLEKHLAAAFYPLRGFGYGRSQTYRQSAPQGSIFKLIPAYAALKQKYQELGLSHPSFKSLNPLEIIDRTHKVGRETFVGYHNDGTPLPRLYKGGLLPRTPKLLGKIDLLKALENSSNPYFSLLLGDILKNSEDFISITKEFTYGGLTGIDLPGEIPGKVPTDIAKNRSGLYAMAIGQHSLVVTPLQTSIMLSSIANGGHILKPNILKMSIEDNFCEDPETIPCPQNFKFKKQLQLVGIDFPLYGIEKKEKKEKKSHVISTLIKHQIFMPKVIQEFLLEGMRRVIIKTQEESLPWLSRFYRDHPEAISDFLELKGEWVGKTSTAEVMENIDLDLTHGTNKYTHVWFGGVSFTKEKGESSHIVFHDSLGRPELVVVVYLRFGVFGKEAAPVAAQVIRKWREIKQNRTKI